MKKLLFILISIMIAFTESESLYAEDVQILIKGMVCEFCVQGVRKALQSEPAIQSVKINLDDSKAYVTLKKNAQLDDKAIKKLVGDTGYEVENIKRITDAPAAKTVVKKHLIRRSQKRKRHWRS